MRLSPCVAGSVHLQLGEDPEGLRVALETVGQPETLPGQSIQHPLAEMAERRMAKIMGVGRGLHHDMIKTAKITKQVTILGAQQSHRDRSGDGGHLDRVGEPVVHDSAGRPAVTTWVTSASRENDSRTGSAPGRCGTPTRPARTARSGSGRDLASRGSMCRTLPNAPVAHSAACAGRLR